MVKFRMISGMAGRSMVSEKNTTKSVLLSMPRASHADRLKITACFLLSSASNTNTHLILFLTWHRIFHGILHKILELLVSQNILFFQPSQGVMSYGISKIRFRRRNCLQYSSSD